MLANLRFIVGNSGIGAMFRITVCFALLAVVPALSAQRTMMVVTPESFRHYVEAFNHDDDEQVTNYIDDRSAWSWLRDNIPFFESSDKELEEIYYFRWWTFRKHIEKTPDGFVITEFLPPVPWAGKFNTISCAAGHHFYEGRWLRNRQYLNDYARFWFSKDGEPRRYSFWAADALQARATVTQDQQLPMDLLPLLIENYERWEKAHLDANGLFWQIDDRDGMEVSIGGSGYRATINSYMYGDAAAIANIADWAGKKQIATEFREKATRLKALVEARLWDSDAGFFKVLPRAEGARLAGVRELHGYVPWYFNLPDPGYEIAWKQLMDSGGFYAPYGPTTAERRSSQFMFPNPHECLWNGPSWPFATTQTLVALANLLNHYQQDYVGKTDYLELLRTYTHTQHFKLPNGRVIPWIDEDYNPITGEPIAREILYGNNDAHKDRGRDYNHSGYADLIISGLVGLRPRIDQSVEVNPLVPEGGLTYFCLDGVPYHGTNLTILYDESGSRYHRGPGIHVFADGREIASATHLQRLTARLPETATGWRKYEGNPIIGGQYGTVFDVAVLKEGEEYRMWGSWRPRKGLALFTSKDGMHWSQPEIVFGPNPDTRWEKDINRPAVVKRADGYHLWYTGQADGRSWIGYATSADGRVWRRMSPQPVLSADQPWEKVAVMCPHVIWDEERRLFRMWYSGGEQYEPDAIGYATSPDGLHWSKHAGNPIFGPGTEKVFDDCRVTACQVVHRAGWYYMFYIGFRDVDHAQIGIARSRDGIMGWERHPDNPIIRPGQESWDHDACYKPFAIFDGKRWLLWYNGRQGNSEQIGLALHEGEDLGFGN